MLDAFDVMLFALVLASLITEFGLTKTQAGMLGSVTLLGGAAGGLIFGHVADRFGRTKALMASVLFYSIFTAMCGFAQSLLQLVVFRVLLGLGMGGEFASGAALVSETWPAKHRGRAFGFMQGSWAIGFAGAALVTGFVLPRWGWRSVFFVGILPALFTLWVQRHVEEPELWLAQQRARRDASKGTEVRASGTTGASGAAGATIASGAPTRFIDVFRGPLARVTVAVTLMNACALFGWWGLNGWVPAYLSLPTSQGGIGLTPYVMSWFVVAMQVGMWLGYVSFGYITDALGRKPVYVVYLLCASALLPLYGAVRTPWVLVLLGPFVAFFGTGFFSGFGALTAELYPTSIRATAQGFTAPFTVGTLATTRGFGPAFAVVGAGYLLAATAWIWIPETKGRELG